MEADNEKGVGDVANKLGGHEPRQQSSSWEAQPEPSKLTGSSAVGNGIGEVVLGTMSCSFVRFKRKGCCIIGKDSEKSNKCDQILEIWSYRQVFSKIHLLREN